MVVGQKPAAPRRPFGNSRIFAIIGFPLQRNKGLAKFFVPAEFCKQLPVASIARFIHRHQPLFWQQRPH
jgi:hypothetical protein